MIAVQDLYKSLRGKPVHRGISFEVDKGESLSIIGGSGSGKSVLLKQLVGLMRPDRGKIFVEGRDITEMDEDALQEVQKMIGYVFQEAALFDSLTVEENVSFGLLNRKVCSPQKAAAIVREKLALVGLADIEKVKPAQLSGGMKKRVGIARAIAMDPAILLYDEPTTGLDPVMSDVISDLIVKLKMEIGITSIVVTHDMKSAYKISDKIAMLYEGKIMEMGTPQQIQSSKNPTVRQFISGSSEGPIAVPRVELS